MRVALWICAVGVGCSSQHPKETGAATTTDSAPQGGLCEVVQSEVVPSVFSLNWSGPEGESFVQYGQEERFDRSTPRRGGQEHSIAVLGLKAGGTYQLQGVTETPDGDVWACDAVEVEVPYPPAELIRVCSSSCLLFYRFVPFSPRVEGLKVAPAMCDSGATIAAKR